MTQKRFKRSPFHLNKYQKQILTLTFIPLIFLYILIILLMMLFYHDFTNIVLAGIPAPKMQLIHEWSTFVLFVLITLITAIIFFAFSLSQNLVGAFERIIRELDHIIDGGEIKVIKARPKDHLANELLERIDILLANLPKPHKKLKR